MMNREQLLQAANRISHDPMDRVPEEMKTVLNEGNILFDTHMHAFNHMDIPENYLRFRLEVSPARLKLISRLLRELDRQLLGRMDDFHAILAQLILDEDEIVQGLHDRYRRLKYRPISCLLMMDMRSIKGDTKRTFQEQIQSVRELQKKFPDEILPFLALDPVQNDRMEEDFIEAFTDQERPFFGVKLYPSLGYLPTHPRLAPIFEVCEQKRIPILSHHSSANVRFSGNKVHVVGMERVGDRFQTVNEEKHFPTKESVRKYFNDPFPWFYVLRDFPELKLNIAHFGGEAEWEKLLEEGESDWVENTVKMVNEYSNVYTDFSYTFYNYKFCLRLKEMMKDNPEFTKKILYGSDFCLTLREGDFDTYVAMFRNVLGKKLFSQISQDNPKAYLFS